MRRALFPAIAAGLAVLGVPLRSPASAPVLIEVRVLGQGAVRVRLAEGRVVPCDSGENRPISTEWIAPGPPRFFRAASQCVCVEHTYGSFRDSEWSLGWIQCGPTRYATAMRIVVRTDQP
jgi:hypothetical protein